MQAAQWLTVVGWPVSALLALVVGILVGRFNRPKKRLIWSVMSEARLVDEQSMREAPTPLRVSIGDKDVQNVALVRVRLGNGGNQEIIKAKAHIVLPEGATVHATQLGANETHGAFGRTVGFLIDASRAEITFEHINPNRNVDIDLLVSGYPVGALSVEMAEPGVDVVRRDPTWWSRPITGIFGQFTAVSLEFAGVGVRYNPTVPALVDVADEIRRLRLAVARASEQRAPDPSAALEQGADDWWTTERSVLGELVNGRFSKSKGKLVLTVAVRNVSPRTLKVTKLSASSTEVGRTSGAVRFTMDPVEVPPGETRSIEIEGIFENPVDASLAGESRAVLGAAVAVVVRDGYETSAPLCSPSGQSRLSGPIYVNG